MSPLLLPLFIATIRRWKWLFSPLVLPSLALLYLMILCWHFSHWNLATTEAVVSAMPIKTALDAIAIEFLPALAIAGVNGLVALLGIVLGAAWRTRRQSQGLSKLSGWLVYPVCVLPAAGLFLTLRGVHGNLGSLFGGLLITWFCTCWFAVIAEVALPRSIATPRWHDLLRNRQYGVTAIVQFMPLTLCAAVFVAAITVDRPYWLTMECITMHIPGSEAPHFANLSKGGTRVFFIGEQHDRYMIVTDHGRDPYLVDKSWIDQDYICKSS